MKYLRRVRGHYYFRIRVPLDLVHILKSKEIKKSLHTESYKNAKLLSKSHSYELDRIFTLMRCGMLTDEQITKMLADFMDNTLNEYEKDRVQGIGVPSLDDIEDPENEGCYSVHYIGCDEGIEQCKKALITNDLKYAESSLDDLLETCSLKLDKDSLEYKHLCREMLKTWININQTEMERILGNYNNEYDKAGKEKATMISALSDTIKQDSKQAKQHESMTLSAVIKHYINEKKDSWVHKTKLENEHIFKLALAIIGDKDVADLTHLDFIAYRDILKTLPTNYEKKKEYQDKTMEEIAGIAKDKGDKPISKKTLNKNLQGTSSLMSWCEKHGYVGKNGAKGLAIKDKQNPSDKRKPYNTEDIQRLINSPIYTNGFPVKRPERFWIPLMGLFSGCRLNEICSLYLKDIVETEGVHCFDINYDGDDKHTKTESSVRKVPVHPLLVKIGLLDYVKKLKLKGEQRLFPKLNYTDGNGYGGAFGKWYGRYSRDFITTDKNKVFHSFRRTVADSLKQQGVDYKQIEEILGHKDDSMSTGYYAEPFNPKILFEALKKLDYGLDFSSIKYPVD